MLGYIVNDQIFVLLNAGQQAQEFKAVDLPKGKWKLIGTNEAIDHINGVKDDASLMQLTGGQPIDVRMSPVSLKIWVKK